ncbi:MAG: undecaprenyl-phosphate glucose phosphotransferase [Candidatus Coatesbacteria bacterium]|nr:MAG: undecaprenyl-phosphate glucose phosphotransferase [Candidatus Coatesbacteria bacterium]
MGYIIATLVLDATVICAAFVLAYYVRFSGFLPMFYGAPRLEPYLIPLPLITIIWLIIIKAFGLYDRRRLRFSFDTFYSVLGAALFGALIVVAVGFFYRGFSYSRLVVIIGALFVFSGLSLNRIIIAQVRLVLLRLGVGERRCLIVGASAAAADLAARIKGSFETEYHLIGVVTGDNGARAVEDVVPVLGDLDGLDAVIERERIHDVFFCSEIPQDRLLELMLACDLKGVGVRIIPSVADLMSSKIYSEEALGVPVFTLRHFRISGFNWLLKRAIDVVVALGCFVVLAPFVAAVALAIKLTSPGPVFYKQIRVGLDGRRFTMYKFRSMVEGAEEETGPIFAKHDDSRVTAVGRLLRRTSLDELPQLMNVLKGEMSLVGPRPERPYFVEKFGTEIPRYLERHKVLSGMTGWAQVNGLRGNTSISERVKYDIFYIENWSLFFDLKILVRTFFNVVRGK